MRFLVCALWSAVSIAPAQSGQVRSTSDELSTLAFAPTANEPARLFGTFGVTLATHYFFRGILQENQGMVLQPSLELNLRLFDAPESALSGATVTLGWWNSVHNGPTAAHGSVRHWYEADVYAGVNVGLFGCVKAGALYTLYTSPNDAFPTVQEVALGTSFDDKSLWGGGVFGGLQPSATVAFEFDGQADLGTDLGTYLEVGVQPSVTFDLANELPLTLAVPLTVGCSLGGYYERAGVDDSFGYVDAGFVASMPLKLRAPRDPSNAPNFGAWTVSAGVDVLFLGDNMQAVNGGDDVEVVGSLSLSCAF